MRQMDIDPSKQRGKLLGRELHVLCRFRLTFLLNRYYAGVTDNQVEAKCGGGQSHPPPSRQVDDSVMEFSMNRCQ